MYIDDKIKKFTEKSVNSSSKVSLLVCVTNNFETNGGKFNMDILEKKTKKIETFKNVSNVLNFFALVCLAYLFADTEQGQRFDNFVFAFCIVSLAISIVFHVLKNKKITELKAEYMQVFMKGNYHLITKMIVPDIVFLQGPNCGVNIAIITITKDNVKFDIIDRKSATEIFNITS